MVESKVSLKEKMDGPACRDSIQPAPYTLGSHSELTENKPHHESSIPSLEGWADFPNHKICDPKNDGPRCCKYSHERWHIPVIRNIAGEEELCRVEWMGG